MLLWCERHCCLCDKQCGGFIQIHHIDRKDDNSIENGIPLCLECHALVHSQTENSPIGTRFKPKELISRRNQIYDKHTAHLVPLIKFGITQTLINPSTGNNSDKKRDLPIVGFYIFHGGGPYPVKLKVKASTYLGGKFIHDFSKCPHDLYSGQRIWHMNPGSGVINGNFGIPKEVVDTTKQLKIRVEVKVIDIYDREHALLPVEYIYMREANDWYFEP